MSGNRGFLWVSSCALLAAAATLELAPPTSAEVVYATSINTGIIYTVDSSTHTVTPFFNAGADLDSLFFDPSGRIVFSELDNGIVAAFNPNTNSRVNLATGLAQPIDMALEPNLTSFLVSTASSNNLTRVSLSGGVLGTLGLGGRRPDGVIYDASGRLFVNTSTGFQNNNSTVTQIDPTTGAIIHSSGNTGIFLDGLTYDSFTGKLFASDYNNGRILELDPNNLTSFTDLTPLGAALSQPDGIVSDGMGNLFIASRANSHVIEYNILTNTATLIGTIDGLDDLAPVAGLGGSQPPPTPTPTGPAASVPEPSSLLLVGGSVLALLGHRRRRQRPTAECRGS
jgi:DNA-binding beta-propeller fold protein YncE